MAITGTVESLNSDNTFTLLQDTGAEVWCKLAPGTQCPSLQKGDRIILQGDYPTDLVPLDDSKWFSVTTIETI
jgi:hypothetical protein